MNDKQINFTVGSNGYLDKQSSIIPISNNSPATHLIETTHVFNDIEATPVYLFCCTISLAAISAFLRSGFILKLAIMLVALISQILALHYSSLYEQYNLLYIQDG